MVSSVANMLTAIALKGGTADSDGLLEIICLRFLALGHMLQLYMMTLWCYFLSLTSSPLSKI